MLRSIWRSVATGRRDHLCPQARARSSPGRRRPGFRRHPAPSRAQGSALAAPRRPAGRRPGWAPAQAAGRDSQPIQAIAAPARRAGSRRPPAHPRRETRMPAAGDRGAGSEAIASSADRIRVRGRIWSSSGARCAAGCAPCRRPPRAGPHESRAREHGQGDLAGQRPDLARGRRIVLDVTPVRRAAPSAGRRFRQRPARKEDPALPPPTSIMTIRGPPGGPPARRVASMASLPWFREAVPEPGHGPDPPMTAAGPLRGGVGRCRRR